MRVMERCSCDAVFEVDHVSVKEVEQLVTDWRGAHPCSERDGQRESLPQSPERPAEPASGWVDGIPGAPKPKVQSVPVWRFDGAEWLLCPWHGHVRAMLVNPPLAGDIVTLRCSSEVEGSWCDVSAPGLADSWAEED